MPGALATRGMKTSKKHLRARAKAAKTSLTVWFSAAVPVLLAIAEALKDQLPLLNGLLGGWTLVGVSVAVSAIVTVLRLRGIGCDDDGIARPRHCSSDYSGWSPSTDSGSSCDGGGGDSGSCGGD